MHIQHIHILCRLSTSLLWLVHNPINLTVLRTVSTKVQNFCLQFWTDLQSVCAKQAISESRNLEKSFWMSFFICTYIERQFSVVKTSDDLSSVTWLFTRILIFRPLFSWSPYIVIYSMPIDVLITRIHLFELPAVILIHPGPFYCITIIIVVFCPQDNSSFPTHVIAARRQNQGRK